MDSLITYPDGIDKPGVEIPTFNGFVSRIVSAVADNNIPDAERVAKILNAHFLVTSDAEEALGQTIDRIDSLAHGLELPIAAAMHVTMLKNLLPEIVRDLKKHFTEVTGSDPWSA